MIHVIYMAAGNSRRFGKNKLMEVWRNKTLYRHGLDTLLEAIRESTIEVSLTVVTQYAEIREEILASYPEFMKKDFHVLLNPDSQKGVSYTIKAGLKYVTKNHDGAEDRFMFMVADQPLIKKDTIIRMMEAALSLREEAEYKGISLRYEGVPGNPCVFHKTLLSELLLLEGDQGGRRVLKEHPCLYIDAKETNELFDIDRVEDLFEEQEA